MASAGQFEEVLLEIVDDVRDEVIEALARGGPEDYAAYREQVGFLRAIEQLAEWCGEATKRLDER